jgi:hypothetical protein
LIPIIPHDASTRGLFSHVFETDGQHFYDEKGTQRSASEYQSTVETALREAGQRLPVRIDGKVHWSVVRLDPKHVRITLIDPGYLDPADRNAEIVLQHLEAVNCTDILSGETLPMGGGRVVLQIPAGVLRIVDIEHR